MRTFRLHFCCLVVSLAAFTSGAAANAFAADKKAETKPKDAPGAEDTKPKYERICEMDVNYLWRAKPILAKFGPQVSREYFTTVSEQGFVPEQISDRLNAKVAAVRADALRVCRGEHQEESGCIAKKFADISKEFPQLDYLRRQLLFSAVRRDCSNYLGECVATEVSEMKCWMNVPPETSVPNEPKIDITQPGNTEPPMNVSGEEPDEESEEETEAADTAQPASGAAAQPGAPAPKKPKKKKTTAAVPVVDEKNPLAQPSLPPPENPYNAPFSIQ